VKRKEEDTMLCERCKKNQANSYYKTTVNGKSEDAYLCSQCAADLKLDSFINEDFFAPFDFGRSLFDQSFFGRALGLTSGAVKHCPTCGATIDYISDTGHVGCADCYETFGSELEKAILRAQGSIKHIGDNDAPERKLLPIDEKRMALKEAIEKEEYEKAATLRDEIKKMEGEQ